MNYSIKEIINLLKKLPIDISCIIMEYSRKLKIEFVNNELHIDNKIKITNSEIISDIKDNYIYNRKYDINKMIRNCFLHQYPYSFTLEKTDNISAKFVYSRCFISFISFSHWTLSY